MTFQAPVGGRAFALPFTRAADPNVELTEKEMRMPLANKVPDHLRNHFIAMYVNKISYMREKRDRHWVWFGPKCHC